MVIQTLRHWRQYLLPQEFILYSDHEALWFLNSQKKLNPIHGHWVEFLQAYTFVLRHKAGVENKVADALSCRISFLVVMSVETIGFEWIREEYATCPDFGEIHTLLWDGLAREWDDFFLQDGYLFHATQLCIPQGSTCDFIIFEVHVGGLSGHFGRNKTIELVEQQFFWPNLKRNVNQSLTSVELVRP